MFKRITSSITATFAQLYYSIIFKAKDYQIVSRLTNSQQKSKNIDELSYTDPDFEKEVDNQNKALLEIVNKTINNVSVDANELDEKKVFEKSYSKHDESKRRGYEY